MKALSLWQPWASLVVAGSKQFETRSWETLYRGPLAIHAAQRWTRDLLSQCKARYFAEAIGRLCPTLGVVPYSKLAAFRADAILPLGMVVGVVDLVAVTLITDANAPESPYERAFGDYTPGRFMWTLENPRRLVTPFTFRGGQSVFNVPDMHIAGKIAFTPGHGEAVV